jgi:hypothetical protein
MHKICEGYQKKNIKHKQYIKSVLIQAQDSFRTLGEILNNTPGSDMA